MQNCCDTPHYENRQDDEVNEVPFEVPEGWCWCVVDDFAYVASGSTPSKDSFVEEGVPYIKMYNLRNQKIDFDFHPQYIKREVHEGKLQRSKTEVGDLIMNIVGPPLGKLAIIPPSLPESNFNQAAVLIRPYSYKDILVNYLFYYLSEMSEINSISTKGSAGQVNISLTQSQNMRIALPPIEEQKRIISAIDNLFQIVDIIDKGSIDIAMAIGKIKSKILEHAIHGKLMPQDPNDEPAIDLLKRINPSFVPCDNAHYENIPKGWTICKLEDIVDYEQPQDYIVKSTDYKQQYKTPVLTAGKSFIIGYTNEEDGICSNLPVIIFDDFTTDSKYVNFPFKVKSSAMKILHVKEEINIQYVYQFMSITRLIGDTHKRYWISEYSKLALPFPPRKEQDRIISRINELFTILDGISAEL